MVKLRDEATVSIGKLVKTRTPQEKTKSNPPPRKNVKGKNSIHLQYDLAVFSRWLAAKCQM